MKKILILTDFSKNARSALYYGLSLFEDEPAVEFTLIHTVSPVHSIPDTSAYLVEIRTEEAKAAFKQLQSDIDADFPKNNFQIKTDVICGDLVDVTISLVKELTIDLVIMGTHGITNFAEVFVGSNTATVIRKVNCTLLAIPNDYIFGGLQKIVLGWDEKKILDNQILQPVLELSGKFSAPISAVNVSNDPSRSFTDRLSLKNKLPDQVRINYVRVFSQNVIKGITEYSKSSNADLLCIINHKLKFIERIFHKNISKNLALNTDIPIMILSKK